MTKKMEIFSKMAHKGEAACFASLLGYLAPDNTPTPPPGNPLGILPLCPTGPENGRKPLEKLLFRIGGWSYTMGYRKT